MFSCSHELMLGCWRKKASDRPTFTNIKTYLEGLIEKEYGRMYIMLENDYEGTYVCTYVLSTESTSTVAG